MKKRIAILSLACAIILSSFTPVVAMDVNICREVQPYGTCNIATQLREFPELYSARERILSTHKTLCHDSNNARAIIEKLKLAAAGEKSAVAWLNTTKNQLVSLSQMLIQQHNLMQTSLNILLIAKCLDKVRIATCDKDPFRAVIPQHNPVAMAAYTPNCGLFHNNCGPEKSSERIDRLISEWRQSHDHDVRLLARTLCEDSISNLADYRRALGIGDFKVILANVQSMAKSLSNCSSGTLTNKSNSHPKTSLARCLQHDALAQLCFTTEQKLCKISRIADQNLDQTCPYSMQAIPDFMQVINALVDDILLYTCTHTQDVELCNAILNATGMIKDDKPGIIQPLQLSHEAVYLLKMNRTLAELVREIPRSVQPTQQQVIQQTIPQPTLFSRMFSSFFGAAPLPVAMPQIPRNNAIQPEVQKTETNVAASKINANAEKLRAKRAAKKRKKKAKAALNAQNVEAESSPTSSNLETEIPQQEATPSPEDVKRAKEELRAARKLQQIEEKLARFAVQQEQKETIPQKLTKAQRKKLNKERDLERLAQAEVKIAPSKESSEESLPQSISIPSAQELTQQAPEELIREVPLKKPVRPVEIDGSYVRKETATSIIIEGPRGTTITLCKKINPSQITPPSSYAPDIQKWRDNPKAMLEERGEIKPNLKDPVQRKKVITHAFAKAVDNFIASHASTCKIYTNKGEREIALCLPGKIRYANGDEEEGFFGYLIDEDTGRCFHRMFEAKDDVSDLAQQLKKHKCFSGYEKL